MPLDSESRTVSILWASDGYALLRRLLTILNDHIDLRLSLWPRAGDPTFLSPKLTKLVASAQLAELVFADGAYPKKPPSQSKAIRGKLLQMRRTYLQLKEWETGLELQGPKRIRYLEKRAYMEPYWDLLCIINGDGIKDPEPVDDCVPEVEILLPPFRTSRVAASKSELGQLLASAAVFASQSPKERSDGGSNYQNVGSATVNGIDDDEDQAGRAQAEDEIPAVDRPQEAVLSKMGHDTGPKTPFNKEARIHEEEEEEEQEEEVLEGLNTLKRPNRVRTPPVTRSSLRSKKAASSSKTDNQIEMHQEAQGMSQIAQTIVEDSQRDMSPQLSVSEGPSEASPLQNPLKRPYLDEVPGPEERRATRRHERYMIDARIRLAEAEILLARINKGFVKE